MDCSQWWSTRLERERIQSEKGSKGFISDRVVALLRFLHFQSRGVFRILSLNNEKETGSRAGDGHGVWLLQNCLCRLQSGTRNTWLTSTPGHSSIATGRRLGMVSPKV